MKCCIVIHCRKAIQSMTYSNDHSFFDKLLQVSMMDSFGNNITSPGVSGVFREDI